MRVLMIAPPGAGKGTQGARIATHFGTSHIATGDLLRSHVARGTRLGRTVQAYLDSGDLVPDEIVLDMVRQAFIAAKAAGGGYVLDGYPRTSAQAWAAYRVASELDVTAEVVLHLRTDDDEVVRRLLTRAAKEHRSDDNEFVIRRRLKLYHHVTQPVLGWYAQRGILLSVDGMRSPDQVTADVIEALEAWRPKGNTMHADPPRPAALPELAAA